MYLSVTDRVLEVGCETGSTAMLLAPNVDQIVASDIRDKMIDIPQQKAKESNVQFVAENIFCDAISNGLHDALAVLNLLRLIQDFD